MTIEIAIPSEIIKAAPPTYGWDIAIQDAVDDFGGEGDPLVWESRLRATYSFSPALFGSDRVARMEDWESVLRDTRLGGNALWINEEIARVHHDLLCGPPADGTRTTFPISGIIDSASDVKSVSVGPGGAEIWQDPTGYTVHTAANLLSDDQFNATDGITDSQAYGTCTIARATELALTGKTSFKITPTGSVGTVGVTSTGAGLIAVTPGDEHTCTAHFRGIGEFNSRILWLQSDKSTPASTPSNTSAATVTGTGGEVVSNTVTATAPGNAAWAAYAPYRTTTSANVFFVGGISFCAGDYDRSHLPSVCGGLIEFTAAQTATHRVICTADAKRFSRCIQRKKGKHSYKVRNAGILKANTIDFVERAQGAW